MNLANIDASLDLGQRFSVLTFAVLFPGYLFYHFAISAGYMPPVFGGFFGIFALALLALLSPVFCHRLMSKGLTSYEWLVLLLISYCAMWAGIHFLIGAPYQGSSLLFVKNLSSLILMLVLFMAARFLPDQVVQPISLFTILFFLMALVVLSNVGENFVIHVITYASRSSVEVSTYQGIARSVLVISLLFLAVSDGATLIIHMVATFVLLLFIGARAEFAGYLIVVAAMLPIWLRSSRSTVFWIVFTFLGAFYVLFFSEISIQSFRIGELFDLAQSSSFRSRQESAREAIQTIIQSPILGDYGSDSSGYAHNALSAWVTYGSLGFLLYVSLVAYPLVDLLRRFSLTSNTTPPILIAAYCFNVYSLAMITLAKHISDPVIAIGWGLYAAASAENVVKRHRSHRPANASAI